MSNDSKNIEILRESDPGLHDIFTDPLQMSQVLSNMLLNAIQSIESSGKIIIRTSTISNNRAEICISDNGIGIEDGIKDKIFYPFFTTKAVGEGTGLGLAISYGIVQNHGGEIIAESGKGNGSTFRIRLPMGEGNG